MDFLRSPVNTKQRTHYLVITTILFVSTSNLLGQKILPSEDLRTTYTQIIKACEQNLTCIESRVLQNFASTRLDCGEIELSVALLIFGKKLSDPGIDLVLDRLALCDTVFPILRYNLGILYAQDRQLDRAEWHLLKGAELLTGADQAPFYSTAGTIALANNKMDAASSYIKKAYQLDSTHVTPLLLNNLAEIALKQHRPQLALKWAELALKRYMQYDMVEEGFVNAEFQDWVNLNLLRASLMTGQPDLAKKYWGALYLPAMKIAPTEIMSIASWYVRLSDEYEWLEAYGSRYTEQLEIQKDLDAMEILVYDPLVVLFDENNQMLLNGLSPLEAWKKIEAHFPVFSNQPPPTSRTSPSINNGLTFLLWGFVCILILVGIFQLRWILSERIHHKKTLSQQWQALYLELRSGIFNPEAEEFIHQHFTSARKKKEQNIMVEPVNLNLTDAEKIVLRDAIANVFPKDTASANKWTPNYVYNIRSDLRRKLNIHPSLSFSSWAEKKELQGQDGSDSSDSIKSGSLPFIALLVLFIITSIPRLYSAEENADLDSVRRWTAYRLQHFDPLAFPSESQWANSLILQDLENASVHLQGYSELFPDLRKEPLPQGISEALYWTVFAASQKFTVSPSPDAVVALPLPENFEKTERLWFLRRMGMAIILLLLANLGLVIFRRKRESKSSDNPTAPAGLAAVIKKLKGEPDNVNNIIHLSLFAIHQGVHPLQVSTKMQNTHWEELNRSEKMIAAFVHDGISVDVIAQELGKDTGTIYNVRSSLRKKLQLEEKEDLQGYLQSCS